MGKDTFGSSCLIILSLSTFLATAYSGRSTSYQEGFGMGYSAHGKGSNVIRETNFGN